MSHAPHGHDEGHAASAAHDLGHVDFPPAPATRSISPAAEDYAVPMRGAGLLWPIVWLLVAVVFVGVYRHEASRGPVIEHDAH
jgi:hypothetical protein